MISFDDFKKLEIKIGKIVAAERVPETDKLMKLALDMGGEERQVIAGIAAEYPNPEDLIGKEVPVVTNLEPKTLRGETSHGMILAADAEGKPVLLHPEKDVPPGSAVK